MLQTIMRRKDVEKRIGLACSTIYSLMADGKFPRPVKVGRRAVGWKEQDIIDWLDSRKEAHDD